MHVSHCGGEEHLEVGEVVSAIVVPDEKNAGKWCAQRVVRSGILMTIFLWLPHPTLLSLDHLTYNLHLPSRYPTARLFDLGIFSARILSLGVIESFTCSFHDFSRKV